MNTGKIYKIVGLSLVALMVASCSKYFEVNPDMRTELNTADKVGQLLVTAYPMTDHLLFSETASDNATDKGPGSYANNDIARGSYYWAELTRTDESYSPNSYWLDMYRIIAAANHAIEAVDDNSAAFGAKGQHYKGEALITRAYAHHMLVSLFSKAYQINGDNSSYGIPYITMPEKNAFQDYDRGTVASVYENIEKDLVEGMKLIKGIVYKQSKFHFNEKAANAFAARFYLFKGEYDKVIQYSSAVFPENNFKQNIRPVAGSWKAVGNPNQLFVSATAPYNLLLANVGTKFMGSSASNRYGGAKALTDMITAVNVTSGRFYQYLTSIGGDPEKPQLNKYILSPQGTSTQVLFSADEVLINRAEAYTQTDQFELALKDLNDFAEVRIVDYKVASHQITEQKVLSFYNTNDLKAGLIQTVLDFRQKAFAHEGFRWFDINRHGLEIEHKHYDSNMQMTVDILKKDDLRRVFQLPTSTALSGLPKNPR
ncbi:RagB/SusD family nutrient uptake outer membrane protein [Sphingobacterium yanglingense]|uniref:SusD-like starch-binding protein associating with outer membrane n=1 Tax=Sphingobacterium yanglingense TaxID=1437280 RepID=A0A4R6WHU4_9SPHI|nr:RagB/SusD family nutrient uptake outer membrane protein [Sphingobacterium yanglingense]TDQ77911.1 SusD-like starch-binding protein associating with outer membrane [Sphingobacterium yanglingense]